MKVVHRVSLHVSPDVIRDLSAAGVNAEVGLSSFDIEESDERWPAVATVITKYQAVDVPRTVFTRQEIEEAAAVRLLASWHHGYPQPSENFEYLGVTYDLTAYCPTCGVGLRQKAPFRMAGEPRWGRRGVLQLNWIFDEFFVLPDVWETVFKPFGVDAQPVLHADSGNKLSTVVQLDIPVCASSRLADCPKEECEVCGQEKYAPVTRTRFPRVEMDSNAHAGKTREHFGSGASAARAVIVSGALVKALRDSNIRGTEFVPVEGITPR